jgi:hypothetical protein
MPKERKRKAAPRRAKSGNVKQAMQRRDKMIAGALKAWNTRAERIAKERKIARNEIREMIAETKSQRAAYARAQKSSAPMKGALSGASAGAAIGSMFSPVGAAIGAGIGAIGGGVWGSADPEGFYQAQPYLSAGAQTAMAIGGGMKQEAWRDKKLDAIKDWGARTPSPLTMGQGAGGTPFTEGRSLSLEPEFQQGGAMFPNQDAALGGLPSAQNITGGNNQALSMAGVTPEQAMLERLMGSNRAAFRG